VKRRDLLGLAAGGSALAVLGPRRAAGAPASARVVVIGAGWGGATAARYLRLWCEGAVEVVLVERDERFVSCPLSNLVLSGTRRIEDLSFGFEHLSQAGVRVVHDEALTVDPVRRRVGLAREGELAYDALVIAPGVDFQFEDIAGYGSAAQERILHAWKAGPQTVALQRQLQGMPEGGVFIIAIPMAPYRCPPAPYERACQVALYCRQHNPRAKVLVLDANESIVSKPALFTAAFKTFYGGMIDYQPNSEVKEVDARAMVVKTDFDTFKGDVLNVIPPMRAARIARSAGLVTANNRWCGVDWLSMASTVHPDIHVLGDATLAASLMPKGGHMANQHAKIAAAAIAARLAGREPPREVVIANACYSYTSDRHAIHVVSVHRYDPKQRELLPVPGAGGLSSENSEAEFPLAEAWARNIWADVLG